MVLQNPLLQDPDKWKTTEAKTTIARTIEVPRARKTQQEQGGKQGHRHYSKLARKKEMATTSVQTITCRPLKI